jgi:hypothetical protein
LRTLTRTELTAALAARQLLLERRRLAPADAIRALTPLQGQHPPAPYIALAARLDGFSRGDLEAAFAARSVVKATIMRLTLHVAAADEYPGYAQLARQARMRNWRSTYAHLDEAQVAAELGAWLAEPRGNAEIRERVARYGGVADDPWTPVIFARTLLPLVQLPPAGAWDDKRRARFVVDQRPLPDPADAAALVLSRYLAAFGPASRRDVAAWAASRSATSPRRGSGWRPSRTATSGAPSCSTSRACRCRRRRRRCRSACSRTGTSRCWRTPTASGSSPPSCCR